MSGSVPRSNRGRGQLEFFRYVVNGVIATIVHFATLTVLLEVARLPLASLANVIAACFGIAVSFVGNRYFVFAGTSGSLAVHAAKFLGLYAAIALMHGAVLLILSDWLAFDYRLGFVIATFVQFILSYSGNKILVFKK